MAILRHSPHVPLFMPVLCYGLGIVFGRFPFLINTHLLLLASCIAAAFFFHCCGKKFRNATYVLILFSFFCFGSFRYLQSYYYYKPSHIIRYCQNDNLNIASIRGKIATLPELRISHGLLSEFDFMKQNGMSFDLHCDSILVDNTWQTVSGIVQIYTAEPMLELAEGQNIELTGRLYRRESAENRSPYYLRKNRVIAACSVDHNELIMINPNAESETSFGHYLTLARINLQKRLGVTIGENATAPGDMFAALLLGERGGISSDTREAFIAGGTMHFLSLSGLHVGMLTALIWLLVRLFSISRFWQGFIPATFILLFILIVPARAPILRAGIISIFFCFGYISRRKSSPINLLALSAFLILIFRPLDIFDAGFQLSYSIALALVIFTPQVFAGVFRDPEKIRLVDYFEIPLLDDRPWYLQQLSWLRKCISAMAIVSIVAWVVSLPLIAWHFNRIAWLAPINSVIMALPVALTMLAGLAKLLVSLALPVFYSTLEPILNSPGELLLALAQYLAVVPGTSENVAPVPLWLMVLYLLALSTNLLFAFYKKYFYLRWSACSMFACLILFVLQAPFHSNTNKLKLHILPAGHGCVTIAELPTGKTILYDCGSYDNFSLGEYYVVPYLRKLGCNSIDAAIVSHSDMDHYSALPDVAARIKIQKMLVPVGFGKHFTASDYRFMELIDLEAVPVDYLAAGDKMSVSNVVIDIIWPVDNNHDNPNESSMVIKITSPDKSILLCGDITPSVMKLLLDSQVDLTADFLLLPHHGEISDVLQDFVDSVSPETAILSAGRLSEAKLQNLNSLCPKLLRPVTEKPVVID